MEDKAKARKLTVILSAAVATPLLLFLLYFLSKGPVTYLQTSGTVEFNEDSLSRFYYPLEWVGARCKPLGKAMVWYCDLWYQPPPDDADAL